MTERKLCGFDLNGWRDFAAKNWRSIPGEEEEIGPIDIVPSGPLSSVVRVGESAASRWIGGAQADFAPHGRGGGWGDVGGEEKRVSVRSLLEMQDDDVGKLSSALLGSASGSAHTIMSIDEGPDGDEVAQEHLIEALARGKFRNGSLVWRPVLAALFAIEHVQVSEDQAVGIICHDRQGLSIQKLRIRNARNMLAPERREAAKLVPCNAGYETLVRNARMAAIGPGGYSARTAHRAIAGSVGRAALGMACDAEILRLLNGDWEILDLSEYDASENLRVPQASLDLAGCDVVLFETLTEGRLKDRLIADIQEAASMEVIALPATAVSRGALEAARRAGDGAPIFFDFLPRLSTIVFGANGAANFDLIRQEETLEAGRTYRSPEPASLAIPAGQESVSVFLRKEASPWPRKANVSLGAPLKQQAAVSLWVEQKPAAGRARILMESPDLGRNFTVDWDEAISDERPWDEIIDSLDAQVSIPKRLVLPCGIEAWKDSDRSAGMLTLLESEPDRGDTDWATLRQKLSQRTFGKYCISSDGELPSEIEAEDLERFDALTSRALYVTERRLRGESGPGTDDNEALKFLTWQFRRCPRNVATWLVDCIEAPGRLHPFVEHQASWVLVYQGLGRIVCEEEDEARAMRLLLTSSVENWTWNRQSAAMAFMLSRSDTAPSHLTRQDVERLTRRTIADFDRNIGGEYTMFHYAPFMLAGLIRWRRVDPMALVIGVDPLADDLLEIIERTERDLKERPRASANFQRRRSKFLPILQDLKSELAGVGSNPDLLLDIYGAGGG
tara:strand:+ start:10910 stop:13273 length:2364 start_codon:yes stop_codon:yes gene_type:complete